MIQDQAPYNLTYLYYIGLFLILADSLIGLSLLSLKRLGATMLPIVLVVTISIIEEVLAKYIGKKYRNNLWILYAFNPIEYACYAWFLSLNIDSPRVKKFIEISVYTFFAVVAVTLYYFITLDPFSESDILNYGLIAEGFLLVIWSIAYLRNIFDQISQYKKLNVYALIVSCAILFYFAFSAIYTVTQSYLINYSIKHNVSINDIEKAENLANQYASKQLHNVRPLFLLTNILLYLCIFVALIKSAARVKKSILI